MASIVINYNTNYINDNSNNNVNDIDSNSNNITADRNTNSSAAIQCT